MIRLMRVFLLSGLLCSAAFALNIKVGIYHNPPKYFPDTMGHPSGFFGELFDHIVKNEGWTVEYVPCRWDECLNKTERGEIDLMLDVAYTSKRAERFDFNRQIILSNWVVLYSNKHTRIDSVMDLDGKRIALLKGSVQEELITKTAREFGITPRLLYVQSLLQGFEVTQAGKADVCAVNELFGREREHQFELYKSKVSFTPDHLHIVSKKGTNAALLAAIDAELKRLKADKTSIYYDLYEKWFSPHSMGKLSLSGEEKRWLKKHPLIRVGIHAHHAPIEFVDSRGRAAGISVHLLEHVGSLLDVTFRFVPFDSFDALKQTIDKGGIDLIANTAGMPRFAHLKPVRLEHAIPIAIFAEESAPRLADPLELKGHTIAVTKGCAFKDQIRKSYPSINFVTVNNYKEAVERVRSGEVDGFAGNQVIVAHFLSEHSYTDIKIAVSTSLNCQPSIGVRHDWALFASILTKALKSIPDSQKAAIRHQHIGIKYDSSVDYSLIGKIGAALLLLFMGMVYWNRRLRKEISERQRAEEKLQQALATLKETQSQLIQENKLDSLSELITNIAHHWRQPLNMLALYIGDLKDAKEFNELDNAYFENFYAKTQDTIAEMSRMIDRFRQFYVEGEEKDVFSLKEAVEKALSMIDANLENNGIDVRLDLQTDANAEGYPNEFSQVLLNILHNAKEVLTQKQRGEKWISIVMDIPSDGKVRLRIADSGGGIKTENIEKIFEPYFTTKFKSKGVGTTLYMAKMVIEKRMNGTIGVENTQEGALFTITMPVSTAAPRDNSSLS